MGSSPDRSGKAVALRLLLDQAREHDDPLRGRVQRVAGRQDQPVVARRGASPRWPWGRRCAALDPVHERPVGHPHLDPVALAELVELAERRAVGRAVPGDRDRPARARQRRPRIVAGAEAQVGRVRARDDDRRDPDRGDADAAQRLPVVGAPVAARAPRRRAAGRASRSRESTRRSTAVGSVPSSLASLSSSLPCCSREYSADTGSCHSSVVTASASSSAPMTTGRRRGDGAKRRTPPLWRLPPQRRLGAAQRARPGVAERAAGADRLGLVLLDDAPARAHDGDDARRGSRPARESTSAASGETCPPAVIRNASQARSSGPRSSARA